MTPTSPTPTTPTPVTPTSSPSYTYVGCFRDMLDADRVFGTYTDDADMTTEVSKGLDGHDLFRTLGSRANKRGGVPASLAPKS